MTVTARAGIVVAAVLAVLALFTNPRGFPLPALALAALCGWGPGSTRRSQVGVALLGLAVLVNLGLGGQLDGHLLYGGDFKTYYVGALVGLHHGWAQIYDQDLQRAAWSAVGGPRVDFLPFLNLPLQAWLVAPLTALPYVVAYSAWVALMGAATIGAVLLARSDRRGRILLIALVLSMWVFQYTLASGQNAMLAALAVALCWWFLERDQDVLAGISLWLLLVRPNPILLVPLALLAARRWRAFGAFLGGAAVVGGASFATLGSAGMQAFVALSREVQVTHPMAHQMTLTGVLGDGPAATLLRGVAVVVTLGLASRLRRSPGAVIGVAVMGSLLSAVYIHQQDYVALLAFFAIISNRAWWAAWVLSAVAVLLAPPGWVFGGAWEWLLVALEVATIAVLVARPPALSPAREDAMG